ncbi:unnamed protein product [Linum tenue]|uniref:Uncharacterized protein n=1 Tax=Linum tenue TaxID=586396 RepID=A0AAV0MHA2_9ROSI|nr:unnamed protein product [Linum tenue]
MKIQFLKL